MNVEISKIQKDNKDYFCVSYKDIDFLFENNEILINSLLSFCFEESTFLFFSDLTGDPNFIKVCLKDLDYNCFIRDCIDKKNIFIKKYKIDKYDDVYTNSSINLFDFIVNLIRPHIKFNGYTLDGFLELMYKKAYSIDIKKENLK